MKNILIIFFVLFSLSASAQFRAKTSATVNAQTGTTYTTTSNDSNNIVTLSNAAAVTVTLSNLAVGSTTTFVNLGAGTVTFATGTLTRVHTASLFSMAGTSSAVTVTVVGTNAILAGDLQ